MQEELAANKKLHAEELQQLRDLTASEHAAAASVFEEFKTKTTYETEDAVKKAKAAGEQELSAERERMSAVSSEILSYF